MWNVVGDRASSLPVLLLELKESYMNKPEAELEIRLKPRITETVSINIPIDTLESLKKVADSRDMSVAALLKFYVGQGLRQDLAKLNDFELSS